MGRPYTRPGALLTARFPSWEEANREMAAWVGPRPLTQEGKQ